MVWVKQILKMQTAWLRIIIPTYLLKAVQAELLKDMATTKLSLLYFPPKSNTGAAWACSRAEAAACRTNMGKTLATEQSAAAGNGPNGKIATLSSSEGG